MSSIGVRLPLSLSDTDGFEMTTTIRSVVKQHLKMLILTNPGERVMDPDFGVGLKQYLFSHYSPAVYGEISENINSQVRDYLPGVTINDIVYNSDHDGVSYLGIRIHYTIRAQAMQDLLQITI